MDLLVQHFWIAEKDNEPKKWIHARQSLWSQDVFRSSIIEKETKFSTMSIFSIFLNSTKLIFLKITFQCNCSVYYDKQIVKYLEKNVGKYTQA